MPTVAITGLSAKSNFGSLRIFSSDWYAFYFEQQNILDSFGDANNSITGIALSSETEPITVLADATHQETGLSVNTSISDISVLTDSLIELTGLGSIIDYGTLVVTGTTDVSVIIGGISLVSELENVTAFAINPVDAEISVTGLGAISSIGSVTANIENPQTFAGGQIKRYPANAFKNSVVKILGITANSSQNAVIAVGSSTINATIMLDNVVSFTQIANINADGVLSINDEELILLMAA